MKKTVEGFTPLGGSHCITNALKQLFCYYGHPLTEEMIFGLGEGLDFTYINLSNAPMVSGRSKILEFEETLAKHLGIKIKFKNGKDDAKIFTAAKKMIDANQPVFVYVDMACLPYLSLHESGHFGGHAVVIFGYDDERECFYTSDRDNNGSPIRTPAGDIAEDFHFVRYEDMRKARSSPSRPFPANNKYIAEIDCKRFRGVDAGNILPAVSGVCKKMLSPAAKLKGIWGIGKFSKEIIKWASFGSGKLKRVGVTNYFQITRDGGTGGGIFRRMYGGFLIESAKMLDNQVFQQAGEGFISLSGKWDALADRMRGLSVDGRADMLEPMSRDIMALHDTELVLLMQLEKECGALLA